jgi:lysozyme
LLVPRSGERARLDLGQSVSETPTTRLKVSREGIVLIKSFEGFRPRATQREDGRWVIGYGHTASAREGLTVAEADAELLLRYDLMPVVKALNEEVHSPLNQHQFDALASFAISVGVARFLASDVLQRLNEGHALQAADALIGWPEDISADARLRRRSAEPEPELAAPEPEPQPEPQPEPASASEPEPADTGPVIPLVSAAPLPSPFPAMASELVLTPAIEADFIEPERPVWPSDQRAPEPVDAESVLFEDEPTLSVLRHEVEPAGPRRFDWSETGAF